MNWMRLILTDNKHNSMMEERSNFAKNKGQPLLVLKKVIYVSTPDDYSCRNTRKRKNSWTSGIVHKKARRGDRSIEMDETEDEKGDEGFELSDYVEHDKNYFFGHLTEICCKLCSFRGELIVEHYKMSHPESEVLISRINPDITEMLIQDAIRNRGEYDKDHSGFGKTRCDFKCPFCLILLNDTTNACYNHISSHTGEYCFHCNHCSYWTFSQMNIHFHLALIHHKIQKAQYEMVYLNPKISKYIFGYICSECNFIQLTQMTVEEHAMVYHSGMPKIYRVNLGVLHHDDNVVDKNRTNEIPSNENHLTLNNSINVVMYKAGETHKIPAEIEEEIEPKKLDSGLHPIELTVFICETNLDIEQCSEETNENTMEANTSISDQLQINSVNEMAEKSEKIQKENKEPKNMNEAEELGEVKAKIKPKRLDDSGCIGLDTFVCQPDLDIKQDFESDRTKMWQWNENMRKVKTSVSDRLQINLVTDSLLRKDEEEALSSEVKLPMISSVMDEGSEDKSRCASVLTAILMTDTEKQNRKSPKAMAVMMKYPLLNAFYKCPEYNCSFVTTLSSSFQKHFAAHDSILMDTLVPCLYCDYKILCSSYVIHLEVKHGHCLFGCGSCFYRTTNSYFVMMHHELVHPNIEFNILQLEVVTSNKINSDATIPNLNEIVAPYNCKDDGFLSCSFKTLYFDEYLKHVEAIHQVDRLGSFSPEREPQKEVLIEEWLAKEVSLFQCRYCKKATVTHQEMGKHQAVFHAQEQCLFYYRKFVPSDTVMTPKQVNLEDLSFINHIIHLPDQLYLCDFKLTDDLLFSTSTKLINGEPKVSLPLLSPPTKDTDADWDQSNVSLDEQEAFNSTANDETCPLVKSNLLLDDTKLQCKWKDCYQTHLSLTALVKHIEDNHVYSQSGKKLTCFWNTCSRKCKPFNRRRYLLLHMRTHSGEKPYKCPFQGCNKAFSQSYYLKIHQKNTCTKRFSSVSNRNIHQKLHYNSEGCQVTNSSKKCLEPSSLQKNLENQMVNEQFKVKLVENKQKKDYNTCEWKGCHQTHHSQMALVKHIEKNHVYSQSGIEFTCFWKNCPRKSKPYLRKNQLVIHLRIHTGEKPLKCPFQGCNRAFSETACLTKHQRSHRGERPYVCQFSNCAKRFFTCRTRNNHQKLHYDNEAYACQVTNCPKSYSEPADLWLHMKSHTVDEQLEAKGTSIEKEQKENDLVQKKFSEALQCKWKDCYQTHHSLTTLVKHIEDDHVYSQSNKKLTCFWNACPRKLKPFNRRSYLLLHMRTHSGEKPFKCPFQGCDKAFAQSYCLKVHQRKCCSKRFSSISNRDNHQRLHYNTEVCQVTNSSKKCVESSSLQKHSENQMVDEQLKVKSIKNEQKKSYNTCKWKGCYQTHHSLTALVKHIEKNHVYSQSGKEFTCFWNDCPKKLKPCLRKKQLTVHMRIHTGEKPLKCPIQGCNRAFAEPSCLTIHQRSHTGERPYVCQFSNCSKRFFTCSTRNNHQRLHYDHEAYACQVTNCPKRYSEPGGLWLHMKSHTVDEQLEAKQKSIEKKLKENDLVHQKFSKAVTSKTVPIDLQCKWKGCYQTCDSQTDLGKHIEKNHIDVQQNTQCTCFWNNCPRKFKPYSIKRNLVIHMRLHSGERPYKCEFEDCDKAYPSPWELKAHHKNHTGKRPYFCQFSNCYRSFTTSYDRDYHQTIHYNTKAYTCQITGCSEKFDNPSGLEKHVKSHMVNEELGIKQKSVEDEQKENDFIIYDL